MAIQVRRGANADFDSSKMLPGEFAVTTDGSRKAYVAFKANDVKEISFKNDINITAENIKNALGYTPADEKDINKLNEKLVQETGKLSGEIDDIENSVVNDTDLKVSIFTDWKQGYVHGENYSDNAHPSDITTCHTVLLNSDDEYVYLDIAEGYKALVCFYDENGEYGGYTSWYTGTSVKVPIRYDKYVIEVRNIDDTSALSPVECDNLISIYYVKAITPKRKVINLTENMSEMLSITESCDINGNGFEINVSEDTQFALYIYGNIQVSVYNLKMKGGRYAACRVGGYANANFYNCDFSDSGSNGLSTVNGSTNCFDCIAKNNVDDGFNYHNDGRNTAYNCYAFNNGDDGISNHENSTLKIVGGRFYGNTKAGIACPTYGATKTDISDVYCANNTYGIYALNGGTTDEIVIIQNAIIENNATGILVDGYQAKLNGVKFIGNTTDKTTSNGGTITEY